jgi:hypothetical protein
MSKYFASQTGVASETGRGIAGSRTPWLTRGQTALWGVQLGLLGAILLGGFDATRFLFRDPVVRGCCSGHLS